MTRSLEGDMTYSFEAPLSLILCRDKKMEYVEHRIHVCSDEKTG